MKIDQIIAKKKEKKKNERETKVVLEMHRKKGLQVGGVLWWEKGYLRNITFYFIQAAQEQIIMLMMLMMVMMIMMMMMMTMMMVVVVVTIGTLRYGNG